MSQCTDGDRLAIQLALTLSVDKQTRICFSSRRSLIQYLFYVNDNLAKVLWGEKLIFLHLNEI